MPLTHYTVSLVLISELGSIWIAGRSSGERKLLSTSGQNFKKGKLRSNRGKIS